MEFTHFEFSYMDKNNVLKSFVLLEHSIKNYSKDLLY